MMSEHPEEAAAVTASAGAVLLNLGNITDVRKQSMQISARCASERNIPFVLDACGAACLPTRRDLALRIIGTATPSVIKGNYSEMTALLNDSYSSSGVDADSSLTLEEVSTSAVTLARQLGTVILASGKTDIVTDGKTLIYIKNGTPQLGSITGTGCMLGALCATYLTAADSLNAAQSACTVFGICGQLAQTDKGSGTFAQNLMDALSTVTDDTIKKLTDMEVIRIEKP